MIIIFHLKGHAVGNSNALIIKFSMKNVIFAKKRLYKAWKYT